ncbi:MAG: di-trans,poly-cis-decaprenylcistransferase [Chloroflexia bacterium]|nr:di-trans,poly-cis-decaprenylcistransferase [Chloroflexia bacterium]
MSGSGPSSPHSRAVPEPLHEKRVGDGDLPLIDPALVPHHVAVIMDGNGRWAAQHGLDRIRGHERGTDNIRRITLTAGRLGITHLTLWAFSTENWSRPAEEVQGILRILSEAITSETEELHRQGARLWHIGELEPLEPALRKSVRDAIELTRHNTGITLTLAFNYGGRREIVHAVQRIVHDGLDPDSIDEEAIRHRLYTPDLPDADLIIRTSGEFRMSNFLLWQGAYAEFFFSPKFWPDFAPDDLIEAVRDYSRRERRFGALSAAGLKR